MHYTFGDYELDGQLYQLRRVGELIELEPKVFDLLVYLIHHHDHVVSKDELLDKLWPKQVVSETALTQCVMAARKAVGDDGTRQHTIKTQHGRGYRFVAALTAPAPSAESGVLSQEEESQAPALSPSPSLRINSVEEAKGQQTETEIERKTRIETEKPRRMRPAYPIGTGLGLLIAILLAIRFWFPSPPGTQPLTPSPPSLALPDKPSIIILPFVNLSGDPTQEYFSDGVTEEITATLSRVAGLFVIARTSAFTYKGKATKVQDISKEMGVRYVLEGSARKGDGQVRIIAQLIDAITGEHLWTERYDRPLQAIFAAQDEIVQKIVTTLQIQLTLWQDGWYVRKATDNVEAYEYSLRAFAYCSRYTKEANGKARELWEKAVKLDPNYAEAYAFLAVTYFLEWNFQWNHDFAVLQHAQQLAQQAIAMNDTLPRAYLTLAYVQLWTKQYDQAVASAERTIALDPNFADGYMLLVQIFSFLGRPAEAVALAEKAMRLNPRHPASYPFELGRVYRLLGRYENAIAAEKKAIAINPNLLHAHFQLASIYSELGREDEARAAAAEVLQLSPNFSLEVWESMTPLKDPAILERWLAAARKAGLK